MKRLILACALFMLPPPPQATDNPWVGTWQLDTAKSYFPGDTLTYSITSGGMVHFSDARKIGFDFALDGRDYKSANNRTTSWTAAGDNVWNSITKVNGVVVSTAHLQLSFNGKTLSVNSTRRLPDGTTMTENMVYTRVTGSTGLVGSWQSAKVGIAAPESYQISSPANGILHWDIPTYKESVEGKPDGSDLPIAGPTTAPSDRTIAFKYLSPTSISYVVKDKGTPVTYGIQTIALDGKSFTDSSWQAGREDERSTSFYAKR